MSETLHMGGHDHWYSILSMVRPQHLMEYILNLYITRSTGELGVIKFVPNIKNTAVALPWLKNLDNFPALCSHSGLTVRVYIVRDL